MRGWLRTVGFFLATAAVPVAGGLFRVWVHQDVVLLGYQLSEAEQERAELQETVRQLQVELAAEKAPEALADKAAKLNLRPPKPSQWAGERPGGAQ